MKKSIALAVILILCMVSFAGCNRGQSGQVVFAVGGSPSEVLVWEQIAGQFSAETGIALKILRQPIETSQRRQGLVVALNSRQSDPDVFLMDIAWLGLFAASGWLAPLKDIDPEPFFSEIIRQVDMVDGELVALPVFLDVGVLYFRTDLLEGPPPDTWSALVETAVRVQKRMRLQAPEFHGFIWQGAQYEGLVVNFLEFAGQSGGFAFENDRLLVQSEPNVRALTLMYDMVHTFGISPPHTFTEMQEEEARLAFQSGRVLFERNWPYAYSLHQAEDSSVRGKTGISALPAPAGGRRAATLGGWHVGVSVFSDAGKHARKFARYITSADVQKKLALELGLPPVRKDLYTDRDILRQSPHFEKLRAILDSARPRPIIPNYILVSEIMQRHLSSALAGDYSPRQALARAQQEIDRLLEHHPVKEPP